MEALLSDEELSKAMLQSNHERADCKLEFIQDGVVLSNHTLFAIDPNTLELILCSDEIELCNAVDTRVKKHKLLLFYYLISNLPKKYRSVVNVINLFVVVVCVLISFCNNKLQFFVTLEETLTLFS